MVGDLRLCSAGEVESPDLPVAGSVGAEVEGGAIARPTGSHIVVVAGGQTVDASARFIHQVDMAVILRALIEDDPSAIRGPARGAGPGFAAGEGQLPDVGSSSISARRIT